MTFREILAQIRVQVQDKGRVTYRALKREFALDDDYIADIAAELIDAEHGARDEDGIGKARVLQIRKGELVLQSGVREPKSETPNPQPLTPSTQAAVEQEAEGHFLKALAIARQQQAKSWELRAATSLARLWQSQGKRAEAYTLLSDVYDWFTEGFDTKDLQEAKALVEDLS